MKDVRGRMWNGFSGWNEWLGVDALLWQRSGSLRMLLIGAGISFAQCVLVLNAGRGSTDVAIDPPHVQTFVCSGNVAVWLMKLTVCFRTFCVLLHRAHVTKIFSKAIKINYITTFIWHIDVMLTFSQPLVSSSELWFPFAARCRYDEQIVLNMKQLVGSRPTLVFVIDLFCSFLLLLYSRIRQYILLEAWVSGSLVLTDDGGSAFMTSALLGSWLLCCVSCCTAAFKVGL